MKISLTGTPGTGKTTISRQFKNKIKIIHLNDLINNFENIWEYDSSRKTKVINIKKLNKIVDKFIKINNINYYIIYKSN